MTKRPFTLAEARASGVTLDALRRKSWRRIGTELYCWSGLADDPWRVLVAWRSQLPPHAVFAGKTAAWLHRLDVEPCNPIEVIAAGIRSRPGLVVRNCHIKEMSIARGLPATTLDVVFRDLRRRLAPAEILVLADQALRLNLGRFHELAEKAESPMETRLRWLLLQSGLPKPEVQANLHDTNGRFLGRADLYYPSAKLVIEYDGGIHRERLVEDNRRQNSILNAGYKLLRFTAADVHQRTDVVVEQVRSSLLTFSYL